MTLYDSVLSTELSKMGQCPHNKGYYNGQKSDVSLKFKHSRRYAPYFWYQGNEMCAI